MATIRKRSVKSVRDELIKKSREAILAAVQIYNNPQITFKSETFITLSNIAWTYLLHAYYRGKGIEYRYFKAKGKKKQFDKPVEVQINIGNLSDALIVKNVHLMKAQRTILNF